MADGSLPVAPLDRGRAAIAAPLPPSAVYLGEVMHRRLRPFRHRFVYRVFSLLLDLDELPALDARLRLFAHNRAALTSFHDRDHGARDGSPLRPWVEARLARERIALGGGRILIHCFPRLLGYVFNPISAYWCFDRSGHLAAIVYEVKNTFGDQHAYVVRAGEPDRGGWLRHAFDKRLHVSPFIGMTARYDFRTRVPGERLVLAIREGDDDGPLLVAVHAARRAPLTDRRLLRCAIAFPLVTLKVIAGIHWEALKLWGKGASFHPRPSPGETRSR